MVTKYLSSAVLSVVLENRRSGIYSLLYICKCYSTGDQRPELLDLEIDASGGVISTRGCALLR